jgi:hypothetical protein
VRFESVERIRNGGERQKGYPERSFWKLARRFV